MNITLENQKRLACTFIDSLDSEMRRIAVYMADHPELGFQEHKAVKALSEFLEKHGLKTETGIAQMPTAFQSENVKKQGPTIVLFAEYDALPEIGHGCGHNISGVAAVAAYLAVSRHMSRGTIRLLGSPAEEGNVPDAGGKVRLIEDGFLKGVAAALSTHAWGTNALTIDWLARMIVEIDFHGKAAHAASAPEQGINALDAAVLTINGINALRQHIRPDIRMHGYMANGGQMINTIPDFARLRYGARAQTGAQAEQVMERLLNCARGGALAAGCRLEWRHAARPYSHLRHNLPMLEAFKANLEALGESAIDHLPVSASTDMGNISQVVPTIHPLIGYGDPKLTGHTKAFAEASRGEPGLASMKLAAKTMAMTCLDLLEDDDLLKRVTADFQNDRL